MQGARCELGARCSAREMSCSVRNGWARCGRCVEHGADFAPRAEYLKKAAAEPAGRVECVVSMIERFERLGAAVRAPSVLPLRYGYGAIKLQDAIKLQNRRFLKRRVRSRSKSSSITPSR
jgi:hypothetical protein